MMRFVHMTIAGIVGWVLSTHLLHGQDWVTAPTSNQPAMMAEACLAAPSAAEIAFWQSPSVGAATDQVFRITKVPFRYGDFGATSYPQGYQRKNYYQSRTDWTWE
jgi:hypothetical protein